MNKIIFYHFCFILLLASTSINGQYSKQDASSNNPSSNQSIRPVSSNNSEFGVAPNSDDNNLTTMTRNITNSLIRNGSTPGGRPADPGSGAFTVSPPVSDPNNSSTREINTNLGNEDNSSPDVLPPTSDPSDSVGRENNTFGNGAGTEPNEPITSGLNDSSVDISNGPTTYPTTPEQNGSTFGGIPTDLGNGAETDASELPTTSNPNESTPGGATSDFDNGAVTDASELPTTSKTNDSTTEGASIDFDNGAATDASEQPTTSNPNKLTPGGASIDFGNGAATDASEQATKSNLNEPTPRGASIDSGNGAAIDASELPTTSNRNESTPGRASNDFGNGAATDASKQPTKSNPNEPTPRGASIGSGNGAATDASELPTTSNQNESTPREASIDSGNGAATDASEQPTTSNSNKLTPGGALIDFGNGGATDTSELSTTSDQESSTPTEVSIDFGTVTDANDDLTTEQTPNNNNSGIEPLRERTCPKRYGYFSDGRGCDSYIECRKFRPIQRLCPDGMHFNANAGWSEYPCGYPQDVRCVGREPQRAQPTDDCPHQFGFFPLEDPSKSYEEKCSRYIMCSAGTAVIMDCPFGLAFDAVSGQCKWPAMVPDCKDFLGFQCPVFQDGVTDDRVRNYEYNAEECRQFWSCIGSDARLLSCDMGLAFDRKTKRCVDEELVDCNHDYSDDYLEPENEAPVENEPNNPNDK